jgi:uncharacterized OsmC-like protein
VTNFKNYNAVVTIYREDNRLKVFKRKVLRKIFGSESEDVRGIGKIAQRGNYKICTAHQMLSE